MTQQTTPRKTVEEIADTACLAIYWALENDASLSARRVMLEAISDAVKGSGAESALREVVAYTVVAQDGITGDTVLSVTNTSLPIAQAQQCKDALTALRALTLPEQPNK